MEIWKDIIGYENLYQVSNLGNIKSLSVVKLNGRYFHLSKEIILSQSKDKDGYLLLSLSNNGKKRMFKVHRLVAEMFIDNPENKKQVNHINGIKTDNRVENLEWNTPKENVNHAYKTGLKSGVKGNLNHNSKLTEYDIINIRKSNKSRIELSNEYKVSISQIRRIILNQRWKHL